MKITKSQLKQIIKEEMESDPALLKAIKGLSDKIEDLDVSIDYLAASVTGDDPVTLGYAQDYLGRYARTKKRKPESETTGLKEEFDLSALEPAVEKIVSAVKVDIARLPPEAQAVALQAIISQLGSEKLAEKKDHPGKSCEEAHAGKEHKEWEDEDHQVTT